MAGSRQLTDIEELRRQLSVTRTEIKNIRQTVSSMKKKQEKDVHDIKKLLGGPLLPTRNEAIPDTGAAESGLPPLRPIAYMESLFHSKNGTPRQSGVCSQARGRFTVLKSIFNNPEHSLEGLGEFSHIWIFFLFHDNGTTYHAKVRPPRLDGARTGVFSTRSPHRPNPVGLTLAKLERAEGATVEVSGIDIIDGTPILDIKPYIPQYDQPVLTEQRHLSQPIGDDDSNFEPIATGKSEEVSPPSGKTKNSIDDETKRDATLINIPESQIAGWINKRDLSKTTFTPHALEGLARVSAELKFLKNSSELKRAIESILGADPRSVYRREKCSDRLYYFTVDSAHVTAWFDRERTEVLRVESSRGREVTETKCTELQ